jgi:hypothetical protein
MLQGVAEDLLLDLGRHPIGVWPAGAAALFNERRHATGLEGPADLVEGVAVVAHETAGLGDVLELGRKLQQRELASRTL